MRSNLVNNSSASVSGPQEQSQREQRSLVLRVRQGGTPGDEDSPSATLDSSKCTRGDRHPPPSFVVIIIIIIFNLSS